MGELRHAFAALVSRTDSLGAIVENLDRFAQNVEGARLSTMVAASYEPSTGNLELISAGHMPPMIHRADGEVEQMPTGGPPLGLGDSLVRSAMKTTLADGDSLWLYTDGLVERRGESVDVGLGRLRQAIANSSLVDISLGLRAVYEKLGRPDSDDVAVIVLMR
jgi:serine phosphatase RsbU (regulator of sigma subunit)